MNAARPFDTSEKDGQFILCLYVIIPAQGTKYKLQPRVVDPDKCPFVPLPQLFRLYVHLLLDKGKGQAPYLIIIRERFSVLVANLQRQAHRADELAPY